MACNVCTSFIDLLWLFREKRYEAYIMSNMCKSMYFFNEQILHLISSVSDEEEVEKLHLI